MLWGFTPASDLIELTKFHFTSFSEYEEINILLLGCMDPRHILKTISQRYRDFKPIKVNFYVIELCMEMYARQIILLTIALEPGDKLGLREKARLFMEIFGNTLLRPASASFIINKSVQLIYGVTDLKFLRKRFPFINLDSLKYKERDSLENIFKFWQKEKFQIIKLWDSRLRHNLGTRYDSRNGVYDWDYHMKLKDIKGCEVINSREYCNWRETGVAFTWLETEFSVPNPTFAAGILKSGDKLLHFGYHGDLQYSPYFTHGIECPDKEMLKTINSIHAHRSTDLFQRNLMRMFYEIENEAEYSPELSDSDVCLGTVITQIGSISFEDTYIKPLPPKEKDDYTSIPINHTITFLPLNLLSDISSKPQYQNKFDIIYLSQALISKASNIMKTAKDNGILIIETQKPFFTLNKEERIKFGGKMDEFAKENGCENLFEFDPVENYYGFYKIKKSQMQSEESSDYVFK